MIFIIGIVCHNFRLILMIFNGCFFRGYIVIIYIYIYIVVIYF